MTPQELMALKLTFYDALVRDPELSAMDLRIAWLLLSRYLNAGSLVAWPSAKTLARDLRSSVRGVRDSIQRLTAPGGWFKIEQGGGRGHSNVYAANFEKVNPASPFHAETVNSTSPFRRARGDKLVIPDGETVNARSLKGELAFRERVNPASPKSLLREPFEEPFEGARARRKNVASCNHKNQPCSARGPRGPGDRVSGYLHAANSRRQPTTKEAGERAGLERLGRLVADQSGHDHGCGVVVAYGNDRADRERARCGQHRGLCDPRSGAQAPTKGSGMTRPLRDLRAGALLKSRSLRLRELARQVERLGLPNATEITRQERLFIVADLAQLGGEVYKIAAGLIDPSDTSPEGLEAKTNLIEAARRVLPWT